MTLKLKVDDRSHSLRLVGSAMNAEMNAAHKRRVPGHCYASDIDLLLLDRRGIVAVIDWKAEGEPVSFAQALAWDDFVRWRVPVFVVTVIGEAGGRDPARVTRYHGAIDLATAGAVTWRRGEDRPVDGWAGFATWEVALRAARAGRRT